MKNIFHVVLIIVIAAITLEAHAFPGESIVQDPVSGDFTITYLDDESNSLTSTIFVPATKIIPSIRSKFRLDRTDMISYNYEISNGKLAKEAIVGFGLEQVGMIAQERQLPSATGTVSDFENAIFANMSAVHSPEDWSGNVVRVLTQSRVVWSYKDVENGGVRSGQTIKGFGFSSPALPGINLTKMHGWGAIFGYSGEGPSEDSAIYNPLQQLIKNNFITRYAAIPSIAVPSPFNAATLLGSIQTQMHTWIGMQLLDTTFSSQLDRYLTAAADAYRHNQPRVVKEDIEKVREMLKREHQDLGRDEEHESDHSHEKNDDKKAKMIDRLAAQVLDFDLQYVLKRMNMNHDSD